MSGEAITGIGVVSGIGLGARAFVDALFDGGRAAPPGGVRRLEGFDPASVLGKQRLIYLDESTRMALCAAAEALRDAGLSASSPPARDRLAVVASTNLGVLDTVCRAARTIRSEGSAALRPIELPNASPNIAASHVAIRFVLRAANLTVATGFPSGLDAVAQAELCLRTGRADAVVVLGVEAMGADAVALMRAGLRSLGAPDCPLGEAAGALVLESEAHARRRGARVRGRVTALAQRQDTAGDAAAALAEAIGAALEQARATPDAIGAVLSNAPVRRWYEETERPALEAALGRDAPIPRTALKAHTGETYGAAGVLQVLAAVACLERRALFPTPAGWGAGRTTSELVERVTPLAVPRTLVLSWGPDESSLAAVVEPGAPA